MKDIINFSIIGIWGITIGVVLHRVAGFIGKSFNLITFFRKVMEEFKR